MIILYKNSTASKKLCKDWYEKRLKIKEDERSRIVQMATEIVLEDIRSKVYDMNYYEIPDLNEGNLFKDVPEYLLFFFLIFCAKVIKKRVPIMFVGWIKKWPQ